MVRLVRQVFGILVLLAFLASVAGRATTVWTCEGKVCSVDLARCCCALPFSTRDDACIAPACEPSSICPGKCYCEPVFTPDVVTVADHAPKSDPGASVLVTIRVTEVACVARQAFVASETPQIKAIPPPDRLPDPPCVACPSLRAPPRPKV